jgi:hypothetical protein
VEDFFALEKSVGRHDSVGKYRTELAAPDSQKSICSLLAAAKMRRGGITYHSPGGIGLGRVSIWIDIDILGCMRWMR